MSQEISRKTIRAFYARLRPGARVECVANTYRAPAVGLAGTVTRATGTHIALRMDDGKPGGMNIPPNVRDFHAITADTITYAIGGSGEHSATWRILSEDGY